MQFHSNISDADMRQLPNSSALNHSSGITGEGAGGEEKAGKE